jgi:hypothetical protein
MKNEELLLAEQRVRYLSEALHKISSDLVQAGMCGYEPKSVEMIEMGSWGLGLFPILGIETVEYTSEEE